MFVWIWGGSYTILDTLCVFSSSSSSMMTGGVCVISADSQYNYKSEIKDDDRRRHTVVHTHKTTTKQKTIYSIKNDLELRDLELRETATHFSFTHNRFLFVKTKFHLKLVLNINIYRYRSRQIQKVKK